MSTEPYDYPEDEFDVAGRDRGPQGAHRTPRPLWRTLLPFVVVLLAAPLLAWGVVNLVGGEDEPAPQATATQEPTEEAAEPTEDPDAATDEDPPAEDETDPAEAEPTEPAEEEPAQEETEEPAEEETEEPAQDEPGTDVDTTASISVLNGAGINGLAGQVAQSLTAEGFTQVVPANYGAGAPATTTLYYNNAGLAATAQAVAETLGISDVQEAPGATQTVDIAVVLRSDFTG